MREGLDALNALVDVVLAYRPITKKKPKRAKKAIRKKRKGKKQ